jgi:hypothetical protein
MRLALLLPIAASLTACTSECDDATRVNGTWAFFHAVGNVGTEGGATVDENYPSYDVFVNGWTRWEIAWSAAGNVTVRMTDAPERQGDYGAAAEQTFQGTMISSEDNCNRVRLDLEGTWDGASGSQHAFTYGADLTFTGDGLAGAFAYSDTWSQTYDTNDTGDGSQVGQTVEGALTGATGEVRAAYQTEGFDTGFAR